MTNTLSRFIFICLCTSSALAMVSCAHPPYGEKPFTYSSDLFLPMTFLEHNAPGAAHLAMNVAQPPVEDLRQRVEARRSLVLQSRSEAQVMVITTAEAEALKKHLPMERINEIARERGLQQKSFFPLCLGRSVSGGTETTSNLDQSFFIVLDSPDLLEVRQAVYEAYVTAGGDSSLFRVTDYQPHILVGVTPRDAGENAHAIRDKRSCVAGLQVDHGR